MTPEAIDRLAPTRRPEGRAVMYQRWRSLLFLHWEVEAEPLRRLLPAGLELDTFEGRAYVGLVPFSMQAVRPAYLPALPWLSYFPETNVRTYVHCGGRDPGVWFFSLEAANPVAVALARRLFHLPYHHARMTLTCAADRCHYTSDRLRPGPAPATSDLRGRPTGPLFQAAPGTREHFLLERYLLYSRRGDRLFRGQVYHTPYPAQPAEALGVEETLLAAAGIRRPDAAPLAHFSPGVDVEVFGLRAVTAG